MAKRSERLTKSKIKTLKPGKHGDGRNLWLIVTPTGRMSWAFFYTIRGIRREKWFASYDEMSPDDAREEAARYRAMLRAGRDPLDEPGKTVPKRLNTFEAVADRAVDSFTEGMTNAKAKNQWMSTLRAYAFPTIGKKDVSSITTEDIFEVLKPIWFEKKETASRLRGRIERIMGYAKVMKLCSGDNPAAYRNNLDQLLTKQGKRAKHHTALPYAKLPEFMADLRQREGTAARALEFTVLTTVRTNDVTQASWSDIDLDAALWTVPREKSKVKDAARASHQVPLSDAAVALLKGLPRIEGSDFVFAKAEGEGLSNAAMDAVLKRMERKSEATVHGFRSTFKDWALEQTAYPDAVSEAALDHMEADKVKAAYKRTTFLEMRTRMMADYAAFIDGQAPAGENVVPIRGAQ